MGERKVLNKYYPADFDPAKICRRRRFKNQQQMKVRTMLPMTIRCNSCGNYMYPGTKLNARKEQVIEDTYLGIKSYRFYFKCTKCLSEIVKKTDPKNADYVVEAGATRPWMIQDEKPEEIGDAIKCLENRSLDSIRKMDVLANLEEVKSMKARRATVSLDTMLEALKNNKKNKEEAEDEDEDEALIKSIFYVRKIHDDDDSDEIPNNVSVKKLKLSTTISTLTHQDDETSDGKQQPTLMAPAQRVKFMVVRKPVPVSKEDTAALQSLCQYDSGDE